MQILSLVFTGSIFMRIICMNNLLRLDFKRLTQSETKFSGHSLFGIHCFFECVASFSLSSISIIRKNLSCFYSNAKVLSLKCKPNVNGNMYVCFRAEVSSYANMVMHRFYCIQTIEVICSKYLVVIYIVVDIYTTSIQEIGSRLDAFVQHGKHLYIRQDMYILYFHRVFLSNNYFK